MSQHSESEWAHAAGMVLGLTTVLTVLLVAFAWPPSELEPRDVPIAAAGQPEAVARIDTTVPDAFDVTLVDSREAAVSAIEDREVYGAILLSPVGSEVLVASAASPAVAQLLGQLGTEMTTATGSTPRVTDVVALPEEDPRGLVFGAGALPLVIGGIAAAAALALRVRSRTVTAVAAVVVAAASGLALAAVLQYWFGAIEGSYLANASVVAMGIGAIALTLIGLHNLLGLPGLGLGAVTVLLLGNPLSGIASAPELLPEGWSMLGQLLPPGAMGTALRSTAFFDGAGAMLPLLVLTGWLVVGAAMASLPVRAYVGQDAARRTTAELPTAAGTPHAT
jgi:hypothetical protein